MTTVHGPWQDSCNSIVSALQYMFRNEIIVDAAFKRDKINTLYAHKLILCIWSPKLADYIMERDKKKTFSITFEEDVDVLKIVLKYLYLSDLQNFCFAKMPIHKLMQAIEICERFEIHHVYQKCKNSLRLRKLNPFNVIDCFQYSLRKNLDDILVKCIKFFEQVGISWRHVNENISLAAIVYILSLDRIALQSEADLLRLAIAWLSFPMNHCYRSEVLSLIDFRAVSWKELQNILKTFPNFFSDSDISSIILGILKEDNRMFPDWYKPKIESTTEKSCSFCIFIHKKIKIKNKVPLLRTDKRKILKFAHQDFDLRFKDIGKVKLLKIELNFGPNEIPLKEFSLQIRRKGMERDSMKNYSIDSDYGCMKYIVTFNEPIVFKSSDNLNMKFYFHDGLLKNSVYLALLNPTELKKINKQSSNDIVTIKLASPKLAIYRKEEKVKKPLVSSFYFNICNNHNTYLNRRYSQFENVEGLFKAIGLLEESTGTIPSIGTHLKIEKDDTDFKMDTKCANAFVINTKDHVKKEITDVETVSDRQASTNNVNLSSHHTTLRMDTEDINTLVSDTNAHIKKEIIDVETMSDPHEFITKNLTLRYHDTNFKMDTECINTHAFDTKTHVKEEIIDVERFRDHPESVPKNISLNSLQYFKAEIIDLTYETDSN